MGLSSMSAELAALQVAPEAKESVHG